MTNDMGHTLEVGDLLCRGNEVGVVQHIQTTPYGFIYNIYWVWENTCGMTTIPQQLLCKAFFNKFIHIKAENKNEQERQAKENKEEEAKGELQGR